VNLHSDNHKEKKPLSPLGFLHSLSKYLWRFSSQRPHDIWSEKLNGSLKLAQPPRANHRYVLWRASRAFVNRKDMTKEFSVNIPDAPA
jgi:hypothetical protein